MRRLLVALGIGVLLGGAGLAATRLGDNGGRTPGRAREPEPAPPSVSGYPSRPTPGATPSPRVRPCEAGHLVARVSAPSVPTRDAPRPDARVIETFSQTYAYGLSAFSPVIKDWTGGGIIGLHGTNDPSSIGRSASHGCIRMRNSDIEALVQLLQLGTPITIR